MNIGVAVLCSPSLISLIVSVDVKHHVYLLMSKDFRAQELCESRRGRPVLPAPNKLLISFCRRNRPSRLRGR